MSVIEGFQWCLLQRGYELRILYFIHFLHLSNPHFLWQRALPIERGMRQPALSSRRIVIDVYWLFHLWGDPGWSLFNIIIIYDFVLSYVCTFVDDMKTKIIDTNSDWSMFTSRLYWRIYLILLATITTTITITITTTIIIDTHTYIYNTWFLHYDSHLSFIESWTIKWPLSTNIQIL